MDEVDAEGRRGSSARSGRLLTLSLQYLADARSPAISRAGAVGAAFDAGYLALLSMVPDERAQGGCDHPNLGLVREACLIAGISEEDRLMGLRLAEAYYDRGHTQFDLQECLALGRARSLRCSASVARSLAAHTIAQ